MYKVYAGDKTIIFSSSPACRSGEQVLHYKEFEDVTLANLLQKLQFTKSLRVASDIPEEAFESFLKSAPLIEAAGGVVHNPAGEVLMILRLGKWDLPKGKMESGENPEECALREVEEECAVKGLTLDKFLTHTYHCYPLAGVEWVIKRTWWYSMKAEPGSMPVPQVEEGITEVRWVAPDKLAPMLTDTYGNIRDVLGAAGYE